VVGIFVWGFPFFFPFPVSIPFPSISFSVPVIHLLFFFSSLSLYGNWFLGYPLASVAGLGKARPPSVYWCIEKFFYKYSPVEFCGEFSRALRYVIPRRYQSTLLLVL